jgi:hypothetical protein
VRAIALEVLGQGEGKVTVTLRGGAEDDALGVGKSGHWWWLESFTVFPAHGV